MYEEFNVSDNTLFDQLGGFEAIIAAVDIFYTKVEQDTLLSPFFEGMNMDGQNQKMVSFMACAFGGPEEYKGRDLREAHKDLIESKGLNNKHFDAVAQHLTATLEQLNINQDLIKQVLSIVSGTRHEVLNR